MLNAGDCLGCDTVGFGRFCLIRVSGEGFKFKSSFRLKLVLVSRFYIGQYNLPSVLVLTCISVGK